MAINKIYKGKEGAEGAANYSGEWAGFAYDRDNDLLFANTDGNIRHIPSSRLISTDAGDLTLNIRDSGAVVQFNNSTSRAVTLPPTVAGARFSFIIQTVTAGAGHNIVPNAADKITGNGLALGDGVAIECDGATDRAGDALVLVGDGVDGWFVESVTGTWSSI